MGGNRGGMLWEMRGTARRGSAAARAAVTPSHSLPRPTSAVTGAGIPERRVPGGAVPGPPEVAW